MEMEGSGFSNLLGNTTDDIFLKTMTDKSIGTMAPNMEMLGFKNVMQTFREDNGELFDSLTNAEVSGYNSSGTAQHTQQASMRIPTDFFSGKHNWALFQKKSGDEKSSQLNLSTHEDHSCDLGQFFLRRHAALHSSQIAMISQAPNGMPVQGTDRIKQDFTRASNFPNSPRIQMHNQLQTIMSASNLSTSFNAPLIETGNTFPSVVNMLNSTLEHKRLGSKTKKENFEGGSHCMLNFEEAARSISYTQGPANQGTTFHLVPSVKAFDNSAIVENTLELKLEGFPSQANEVQMGTISREHSQSESSSAAPDLSTGFEVCDGSAQSGHKYTNHSTRKLVGQGALEHDSMSNEYKEMIMENDPIDARKNGSLVRMGSVSSVERADPTKKRRVERSRKMAEVKERNLMPSLPLDMQAILKRCDNLEKEVRSLKLNISFMNRKDSEQAKQLEELRKENEELVDEKERLEEEIERFISQSRNM